MIKSIINSEHNDDDDKTISETFLRYFIVLTSKIIK